MALSQATLKAALLDLMFNRRTLEPLEAAANWAEAFDAYGSLVANANGDGPLVAPNKAGFQAALGLTSFLSTQTAQEFGTAWAAYFTGLAFTPGAPLLINAGPCLNIGGTSIFSAIATSVVVVVNPVPLVTALSLHFATFRTIDPDEAADALATIFHNHTINPVNLAVLTSGSDTSPPPVPITNTCRVF